MSSVDSGDQLFHLSILRTCLVLTRSLLSQYLLNEGIWLESSESRLKGQGLNVLK